MLTSAPEHGVEVGGAAARILVEHELRDHVPLRTPEHIFRILDTIVVLRQYAKG